MKQFLYTVSVILAAALLALVITGLFVDEVRYTATARVKAPVADSWTTFLDPGPTSALATKSGTHGSH